MTSDAASTKRGRKFWIGVVSRSHVRIGVEGGFAQVNTARGRRCNA